MTISDSAVEGVRKAETLLRYAAHRLATQPAVNATVHDVIALSDAAIELIEAKVAMAANVSAFHAADELHKSLFDLVG